MLLSLSHVPVVHIVLSWPPDFPISSLHRVNGLPLLLDSSLGSRSVTLTVRRSLVLPITCPAYEVYHLSIHRMLVSYAEALLLSPSYVLLVTLAIRVLQIIRQSRGGSAVSANATIIILPACDAFEV